MTVSAVSIGHESCTVILTMQRISTMVFSVLGSRKKKMDAYINMVPAMMK